MKSTRTYQFSKKIGAGGFGEVYIAKQEGIDRVIAIKRILPHHANDDEFIERFEIEAQIVARLEHPNIVPLFDYWRDSDGAYLVMRYLAGGSLADSLKEKGRWELEPANRLLSQIAEALYVAHSKNVIHQDLKPGNILLDELGNAYLGDFGIARVLDTDINLAVDPDQIIHGSPAYISPEYLEEDDITHKSDIYSLGILMYEILTGEMPFKGGVQELIKQQKYSEIPSLKTKRPDLPERLNDVLRQATLKDPRDRYDSTLEMARDFRDVVLGLERPVAPSSQLAFELSEMPISNPYKGLRPFEEADAGDFYGRESLITKLTERLSEPEMFSRFLAVIGPSGSGKSSVVKAGLLPVIRKGEIENVGRVFITEMTPGMRPMQVLSNALLNVAVVADETFLEDLQRKDFDLATMVRRAMGTKNQMLLVIDQFEELFTLANDDEREQFLQTVYEAIIAPDSQIRVIATLRADFYDRPLAYLGWGDLFHDRSEVVLPMSRNDIEAAITMPAEKAGLSLQGELVERIIADVEEQIGSLPLLQYALAELFERRQGLLLTLQAYQALGGVSGALAKRAEETYNTLGEPEQLMAKRIFPRLVKLGEGNEDTRRRVILLELLSIGDDREAAQDVLDIFVDNRLLTYDHDDETRIPTVEIAHEALIRGWLRLRGWLNSNRDDLRRQEELARATQDWLESKNDESYLAAGARLASFEVLIGKETVALNKDEANYLNASMERAQQIENRRRLFTLVLGIISIVAVISAGIAIIFGQLAERARDLAVAEARTSNSRALAAAARNDIAHPDLAALLAVEAFTIDDTYEARNSLLMVLQTYPRLKTYLHGHSDFVRTIATTTDQSLFVSGGRDSVVRLWDAESFTEVAAFAGHDDWINDVAISPDDSLVASASRDNTLRVWDIETGAEVMTLTEHEDEVRTAAFSPDGTYLVSADATGMILVWDVETAETITTIAAHADLIYALDFSPDGSQLVSGGADNMIRIWDTAEWDEVLILQGHTNWVLDVSYSPNGFYIASASADNSVRVWNAATGDPVWAQLAHTDWSRTVAFSADSRQVFSGGADGLIIVWDVVSQNVLDAFRNTQSAAIWDMIVTDDAIGVAGLQNPLTIWEQQATLALGEPLNTFEHSIAYADVSETGIVATAGDQPDEFDITLYNPADDSTMTLTGHEANITGLAFDGSLLASADTDGQVRVWEDDMLLGEFSTESTLFGLAFQNNVLALGTNTGDMLIWDVADDPDDWVLRTTLSGHDNRILDLAFSPDGSQFASSSRDGTVLLWDMATNEILHELAAHIEGVQTLAFSPDGAMLATGSRDQTIILWNTTTGERVGDAFAEHQNWVLDVAFSPDGEILASASGDQMIMLWDVKQRVRLGQPFDEGHTDWINQVIFSPDGEILYSGGRDNALIGWSTTVRAWEQRACEIANRSFTTAEQNLYFFDRTPPQNICMRSEADS